VYWCGGVIELNFIDMAQRVRSNIVVSFLVFQSINMFN